MEKKEVAKTNRNTTRAGLILALLLGVGITAWARSKKKSSRSLQFVKAHWDDDYLTYKVDAPGRGKTSPNIARVGDDNKLLSFGPFTVLINSDTNTNMVSVALFGDDISVPKERIVVDFIRKNVTIEPKNPVT